jgi:cellulose synthase/poly-beta-1,6-N-acetylglucosamine synthase-like glycosyltransferase
VVFTDATTRLDGGVLKALVRNFADLEVGCVAGTLVYQGSAENATAHGGTAYWSYELGLRTAESALGSLVGVSGCLYAVRRSKYLEIAPDLISDFVIAMRMRGQGLRTILEPDAICFEDTLDRSDKELSMRVRVAVRSIHALLSERRFLSLPRFGAFAWQLWSHKALRYASPFLCIALLILNIALADLQPYRAILWIQLIVLGLGGAGFLLHDRVSGLRVLNQAYYFLLTNLASLIAVYRYSRGERIVTWRPMR